MGAVFAFLFCVIVTVGLFVASARFLIVIMILQQQVLQFLQLLWSLFPSSQASILLLGVL